jgi:hypothetical protein
MEFANARPAVLPSHTGDWSSTASFKVELRVSVTAIGCVSDGFDADGISLFDAAHRVALLPLMADLYHDDIA